ncbi:hypothetical protein [Streptomyces wuyuanensis]|uniref:hypothetical protein n=1 Tax=Streptomyces wuyuanensis TaxID=1196353 RepID=UPI0037236BDF
MTRLWSLAALTPPALLLTTACEQATPARTSTEPAAPSVQEADRRQGHAVTTTVLESASLGPRICSAVLTTMPPTCGGPDVIGWDWSAVTSKSAGGTRWGTYHLTGTWDGTRFTLTAPARTADPRKQPDSGEDGPAPATPCPAPPGGWKAVDPAKTSHTAQESLVADAEKDPEFAGRWISYPEGAQKGPAVLVMQYTRDLPGHESEIRRIWGGPLCLVGAKHSHAELRKVRAELIRLVDARTPGFMGVGEDPRNNRVRLYVPAPSDHMQRDLDRRFGKGVVGIRTAVAMEAMPSAG